MKKTFKIMSFIVITAVLLVMIPALTVSAANTEIRFIIHSDGEAPYLNEVAEDILQPCNLRLTEGTGTDGENIPDNNNYVTDYEQYIIYAFKLGDKDVSAMISIVIGNRFFVEASKDKQNWIEIAKVAEITDETEGNKNMFRRAFDLSPVLAGSPGGTVYVRISNSFPDGGHGANIGGELALLASEIPFTVNPEKALIPSGRPINAVKNLADLVIFGEPIVEAPAPAVPEVVEEKAPVEVPVEVPEAAAAPVVVPAAPVQTVTVSIPSPRTVDPIVIFALSSIISAAGITVARKKYK